MTPSSIVLVVVFLVGTFAIYKVVENNNKNPWEFYDGAVFESDMQNFQKDKESKQNQLILFGILGLIGITVVYYFTKVSDDKKDPVKNLNTLLENDIIDKTEYDEQKKRIEQANREKDIAKEKDKIIQELNNLKKNKIITEQEYTDKLNLINKKYESK